MDKKVLVKCERLDNFGRGIGKVSDKIIFVPNLLPSEEAIVEIVSDKKNYMNGEIISLKKQSLDRVCSNCSYNSCGCSLKSLSYEKTLEYKREKVKDILKRIGGIDFDIKSIVPSDNIFGYRNKISLKVVDGKIGYFKNNSNDLIEIDKCVVATDRINEVIGVLKKCDLSLVFEIIIKDMDELMIIINGKMDVNSLKPFADSIYMNDKLVYGKEKVLKNVLDYKFYVSKDAFFQINDDVTKKLYLKVLEFAGKGDNVLDLYCGTGTISLLLSKQFKKVTGIEINKEAVSCANENKKLNNIRNINFMCGDANKLTKNLMADVIVVDPARSGLMKDGIKNILNIKPKKIVYVSCNPLSLARDLRELTQFYDVKKIELYDMFPWTHHVEVVSLLCLKTLEK